MPDCNVRKPTNDEVKGGYAVWGVYIINIIRVND